MVAIPIWRPLLQNSDKTSFLDIGQDDFFRYIRQAKSFEGCVEAVENVVERELAVDSYLDFAAILFKFPCIEPPGTGQPKVDAYVTDEVFRMRRFGVVGKVGRRAHDRETEVGADPCGNHVFCQMLP